MSQLTTNSKCGSLSFEYRLPSLGNSKEKLFLLSLSFAPPNLIKSFFCKINCIADLLSMMSTREVLLGFRVQLVLNREVLQWNYNHLASEAIHGCSNHLLGLSWIDSRTLYLFHRLYSFWAVKLRWLLSIFYCCCLDWKRLLLTWLDREPLLVVGMALKGEVIEILKHDITVQNTYEKTYNHEYSGLLTVSQYSFTFCAFTSFFVYSFTKYY